MRILPDDGAGEYWVVDFGNGLLLITENAPGVWNAQYYPIEGAFDAVGPDSLGNIYVTARADPPRLDTFSTVTRTVEHSMILENILTGLALSADESILYVCALAWPTLADPWYSPSDGDKHPDSGRIFEVDLSSQTITRTAVVGALPQTVYVTPYDTLLVSTDEGVGITKPLNEEWDIDVGCEEYVDVVDINTFQRVTRFQCNCCAADYASDFVQWSADGRYVAMCNPFITWLDIRPDFLCGIWIIDTATSTIDRTLEVMGPNDCHTGVWSLFVSNYYPGEVYLASMNNCPPDEHKLVVIDYETGEFVRAIYIDEHANPCYIHELPDGRLILTEGRIGKILIIDPTG